jgi:hypothetical protein
MKKIIKAYKYNRRGKIKRILIQKLKYNLGKANLKKKSNNICFKETIMIINKKKKMNLLNILNNN